VKFVVGRRYSDPEKAARKILEIANSVEAVRDGRHFFEERGSPAEYKEGLDLAVARGWLALHESGTYVRFTQAGAALFA